MKTEKNTIGSLMARLVEDENGCLIWTGRCSNGYGQACFESRPWQVHRLIYVFLIGPIPAGYQLHHLYGKRSCANPLHLQEVTAREHSLLKGHVGAAVAARTHCPQGHLLQPTPPGTRPESRRYCLECARAKVHRYRASRGPNTPTIHRTHCKRDHPLSGENLYVAPDGGYYCRTCRRDEKQERRRRRPLPPKPPKTHCVHGHPMEGDNLRINSGGERVCGACARRRSQEHKERKRAQQAG